MLVLIEWILSTTDISLSLSLFWEVITRVPQVWLTILHTRTWVHSEPLFPVVKGSSFAGSVLADSERCSSSFQSSFPLGSSGGSTTPQRELSQPPSGWEGATEATRMETPFNKHTATITTCRPVYRFVWTEALWDHLAQIYCKYNVLLKKQSWVFWPLVYSHSSSGEAISH